MKLERDTKQKRAGRRGVIRLFNMSDMMRKLQQLDHQRPKRILYTAGKISKKCIMKVVLKKN